MTGGKGLGIEVPEGGELYSFINSLCVVFSQHGGHPVIVLTSLPLLQMRNI